MSLDGIAVQNMQKNARLWIAGHTGMVGSALLRKLTENGYSNFLLRSHSELDLRDASAVETFVQEERPELVILAAAKVGGISANREFMAEFLLENLQIQNNVISSAWKHGVKKLCFLASNCIYPRDAVQPFREESLLDGPPETTNEGYALAKIAGLRLCQYLSRQYGLRTISLIPCCLYGKNDHFEPERSHVMAAMVKRFCDAADSGVNEVVCWGSGRPKREFLNVDDFAEIACKLLETYEDPGVLNVGSAEEIGMRELAERVAACAGYRGTIRWDRSKPDGIGRKILDSSRLHAWSSWRPRIALEEGIRSMIEEYRSKKSRRRV